MATRRDRRADSIVRQVEALHPPQDGIEGQRELLDGAKESVRLVGVAVDDTGKGALGPSLGSPSGSSGRLLEGQKGGGPSLPQSRPGFRSRRCCSNRARAWRICST
jgi:hypothetical protein